MPLQSKVFTVYAVKNRIDGKQYVGFTMLSVEARWRGHVNSALGNARCKFHYAIRKHGPENFKLRKLEICASLLTAKLREIYWIAKLGTFKRFVGYNLTKGGDGVHGLKFSAKHREEMSKRLKALWNDPETRVLLLAGSRVPGRNKLLRDGWARHPESKKKLSTLLKRRWRTGNYAILQAEITRTRWKNAAYRAKMVAKAKEQFGTKEGRKRISDIMKRNWATPKFRARQLRFRRSKKYRAIISAGQQRQAKDPAICKRRSIAAKRMWQAGGKRRISQSSMRAKTSEAAKSCWRRPAWRKRQMKIRSSKAYSKRMSAAQLKRYAKERR